MVSVVAAVVVAVGSGAFCGVQELTAEGLEAGQRVGIAIRPALKEEGALDRLLDGDVRTSHFSSGQLTFDKGANPTITVDLRGARLVTAVHVGYAGAIKLTGVQRRHGSGWTEVPIGAWKDEKADYPATSWLMGEDLSVPADALRLEWSTSEGVGQLTELRVFGERSDDPRPIGELGVQPRLPVAYRDAEIVVDLRNVEGGASRSIGVRCALVHEESGARIVCGERVEKIDAYRSHTVVFRVRMPGPGRYRLAATPVDTSSAELCVPVYVTHRELQFIWFGVPKDARWATMVCNVSLPHEVAGWRRRGVVALDWAGGYCYREKFDEDGFATYWTERLKRHPVGIAVDEFGNHAGKPTDCQMANGLVRAHRAVPDKCIVVWQAGVSPQEVGPAYQVAADWVIPECYMNYFKNNRRQFDFRIKRTRELGLMHKTVMGLSSTSDKIGTTAEDLESQVRYIRRLAPEMPGLGFYKAYGTGAALVPVADALCFKYFIQPTLFAERDRQRKGRVLVRNIGATPARDVAVSIRAGKTIKKQCIAGLDPDMVAEVVVDASKFASDCVTFQVEPAAHYSCVSDALEIPLR